MPSPLRVLIVEDTPERQEVLKQLFRDQAWVLVHSVRRAVNLLDAFQFDVISLDYNLAGMETGDEVARCVREGRNRTARVIVHSMNPQGRDRIRALLPEALVFPVASMTRTNERFKRLRAALQEGPGFDWSFAVRGSRARRDGEGGGAGDV